jgi:hypothetical protein
VFVVSLFSLLVVLLYAYQFVSAFIFFLCLFCLSLGSYGFGDESSRRVRGEETDALA